MFQLPWLSNWHEYRHTKSKAILGRWFTWTFDTTKLEATRGGKERFWNSLIKKKKIIITWKNVSNASVSAMHVSQLPPFLMKSWWGIYVETSPFWKLTFVQKKTWIRNRCSRNQNLVMSAQHQPLGKTRVCSPGFWPAFCYSSFNCFLLVYVCI